MEGLRADLGAAEAAVASLSAELAAAEADQFVAQASLDAVQAEVGRGSRGRPEITPQDQELIDTLRGLVGTSGLPIQPLLAA
ncbi:MAG: hypothetical protein ACKPKO_13155, partial [Candidatus Fonsibacter sp.]